MTDVDNFKPWELKWDSVHVQRFWDWQSENPDKARLYFSRLVGDAILDEASHYIRLAGIAVDLGAGPGYLVEKLIKREVNTYAIDSSSTSVELLINCFQGQQHFMGAKMSSIENITIDDEFADIVFLVETVEHLDDETLSKVLSEAYRILKPTGAIIITTPNQEHLPENHIMCPDCGCVFHIVQHVRSLSSASLGDMMKTAGFTKIVSKPTLFSWHKRLLRPFQRLKYRLMQKSFPHLLYIGKK